jgi:hypothetical protein
MSCPYTKEQFQYLFDDLTNRISEISRSRLDEAWDEMTDGERGVVKVAMLLLEMFQGNKENENPSPVSVGVGAAMAVSHKKLIDRAATQVEVCRYAANDYAEQDEYVMAMLRGAAQFAEEVKKFLENG